VLILSASMGDGHLQVSRELARRLTDRGHVVRVADLLALMPRPAGQALREVYPWLVNRAPYLYEAIYQRVFLADRGRAQRRASLPVRLSLSGLRRLADRFNPRLVVSTYHLSGVAAAQLRASGQLGAGLVTFVTTFGVHNLWLHPATDLYLCITPAVAACIAERTGAPTAVCEPVVRPEFCPQAEGAAIRGRLRVRPGERVVLVAAGSLGLGRVSRAVRAVAAVPGWRPVVVCGRNEGLRREVARNPAAVALGWVADMAPLMAAADVVLDNAAGSTAKEAMAVGRPVVTFAPLPGHGRHDAMMMAQAGLTDVTDDPGELARLLGELTGAGRGAARVARGRSLFGTDPARLIEAFAAPGGLPVT
jgi:UDP-N-acetylglucosamine:LPS N-acetylglucosamine transferase